MSDSPDRLLKSYRFRAEREDGWLKLEALLGRLTKRSARSLNDEDLLALPVLYRQALSSLSVARAISLDQNLIDYLESLATRAYFVVYGPRTTLIERLSSFFTHDWPAAAKSLWRESLASLAFTALGVVAAYAMTLHDPSWFSGFMPSDLAGGRGPTASTAELRNTLYGGQHEPLSAFATFLFSHNAGVALFAFALGFALCLPTAMLMVYNGLTLGAFVALFVSRGLGLQVGGWLAIHGVTEISALTLAGAAGFRLGWTVAFPGDRTRVDALAAAGREASTLMVGVVVMLMVAGALEGLGRQLIQNDIARYSIAAFTAVMWIAYLYLPWGRRPPA